ncbi:MAG: NAD(P)-binding protein [bacterium]|nr:NAD(P)-binding protein [bacterium]
MTILIAGGGIGGLCTAIALAQNGISSHILEQADTFSEAGAGIQIGPNGMRLLLDWGMDDLLSCRGATPAFVHIHDGISGVSLNKVPLGNTARERYGAPYKVFHRSELQMALLEKVRSMPEIEITTAFQIKEIREPPNELIILSSGGDRYSGRLLIGADGLWSHTRKHLFPDIAPHFIGKTAWRTLAASEDVPEPFNKHETGLWMAPNAHLVHYPVLGGDIINVVAVIQDSYNQQGWSREGRAKDLLPHFESWDELPRAFLKARTNWHKWALFDIAPLRSWSKGRVCLLGDAAHPAIPFLAQGGVMAMEDAHILAHLLDLYGEDHRTAFAQYESQRRARATHVMNTAKKLGRIYHMKGFMRHARNVVLTHKKPEKLLADYDWLYGFEISQRSK